MGATHISIVNQKIVDIITEAKESLGIIDVFYGDKALIRSVPTVCVEPSMKAIVPTNTQFTAVRVFEHFVIIYHSRVTDEEARKKETDEVAEAVEDLLNTDKTLDGLVYSGFVTEVTPGYAERGGMMVATRITWVGRSKERM
jgi:hypothetical protein